MNKYLITIIISTFLFSCNNSKETEIEVLSNHKNKKIYLIESKDNLSFNNHSKVLDSTITDENGKFYFRLKINKPDFYQLKVEHGAKYFNLIHNLDIYLKPGEKVNIKIGNKTVIKDKSMLNSLQIKMDSIYNLENLSNSKKYKLSMRKHEERIMKKNQSLNDFLSKNVSLLPIEFKQYLNAKIKILEINENWDYLKYHNYYSGVGDGMQYFYVDSIPKKWKVSIDSKLNKYNFLDTYKKYISGFINHKFETLNSTIKSDEKWDVEFKNKISIIKKELKGVNRDVAFFALTDSFWKYLSTSSINFYNLLQKLDIYFAENYSEIEYYKAFKKSFNDYNKIATGKTAPNFTFKDIKGKKKSLTDFKGNIIYLDFWGTWCAPCIESIPKHLDLQKKYQNKNVKFIYVALESKDKGMYFEKWTRFLDKKKFTGIHLIANNQFNNSQLAPYLVSSAPTYVLIDKKGKIVIPRADGPTGISKSIDKLLN